MARQKAEALGLHGADRDPTKPPHWDYADAMALRALAAGNANEGQQRRAIHWIVRAAADTYGLSFRMGDPHGTSFAEGRRFVGTQIVKLVEMPADILAKVREREERQAQEVKPQKVKHD